MTRLHPQTLLAVADHMELAAQKIYDKRDRLPADDHEGWLRLDGAGTALRNYGARLKRLALPARKRKRRAVRRGKAGR